MKVKNMTGRTGRAVANQFIIEADCGDYFQSYNSVIAFVPMKASYCSRVRLKCFPIQLDRNKWDYSKTTGRYRNQFFGETKKETQIKIDSGEYILTNLN